MSGTHFLLLDGWQYRRPPHHWQGWLAERLVERGASVDYLTLPDPEHPTFEAWSAAIVRALEARPLPIVVAHGLCAVVWLQLCGSAAGRALAPLAERAILVAPPAPDRAVPEHGAAVDVRQTVSAESVAAATVGGSLLVYSDDDPYLPAGAGAVYGPPFDLPSVLVAEGRHLNQDSGFGAWPQMLAWCETGHWPSASAHDELVRSVERGFQPSGRRLGILVAGDVSNDTVVAIDDVLRERGADPVRHRALLTPRVDESELRPEEVADFGRRYGHEYSVAVFGRNLAADPARAAQIESAYTQSGCRVLWENSQSHKIVT